MKKIIIVGIILIICLFLLSKIIYPETLEIIEIPAKIIGGIN